MSQIEDPQLYAKFIQTICNSEKQVIKFLRYCNIHNLKVERARLILAQSNINFDSFSIFRRIDRSGNGYLTENDLAAFLKFHTLNINLS